MKERTMARIEDLIYSDLLDVYHAGRWVGVIQAVVVSHFSLIGTLWSAAKCLYNDIMEWEAEA